MLCYHVKWYGRFCIFSSKMVLKGLLGSSLSNSYVVLVFMTIVTDGHCHYHLSMIIMMKVVVPDAHFSLLMRCRPLAAWPPFCRDGLSHPRMRMCSDEDKSTEGMFHSFAPFFLFPSPPKPFFQKHSRFFIFSCLSFSSVIPFNIPCFFINPFSDIILVLFLWPYEQTALKNPV